MRDGRSSRRSGCSFASRFFRSSCLAFGFTYLLCSAAVSAETHELLIRNVQVVDGTGAPAFQADVLIRGDEIAAVGPVAPEAAATADRVIEGRGRTLAPGFINMHAHGDPLTQSFESSLAMGVTTIVLGQDGSGVAASGDAARGGFAGWAKAAEAAGMPLNVAVLVGHGSLPMRIPTLRATPVSVSCFRNGLCHPRIIQP